MSKRRPLQWIGETSAEDIADALLAVDLQKAVQVAGVVVARSGIQVGQIIERAEGRFHKDPVGTTARVLRGAFGALSGD